MTSSMLRSVALSEDMPSRDSCMDSRAASRGRQRGRSLTRSHTPRKEMRTDETSTLRGRSRERALSPLAGSCSRNPSASVVSPSRQLLHTRRIRDSRRREHCPSRAASPSRHSPQSSLAARRVHTRSRKRSPAPRTVIDPHRPALDHHQHSGLRHEILVDSGDENSKNENDTMR